MMKIKRIVNGTEIEFELTETEIHNAYKLQKREYLMNDVEDRIFQNEDITPTNENLEEIVDLAERCLDRNDGLWDSYWDSIEYAIEERLMNKENEEDDED